MLLVGSGSGVSRPRESAGGIRVDDERAPPTRQEAHEGSLDDGDLGVEGRLPGAQGLAPLGHSL